MPWCKLIDNRSVFVKVMIAAICVYCSMSVYAVEIHVAKTGNDNTNSGTLGSPYLTISKAAQMAQAGDVVIVHAGTYREAVDPPRGGTSETNRITYRAAANEDVIICGSERITTWVSQGNNIWKVDLPTSFFGSFNPFAQWVSGRNLNDSFTVHRGEVYLNGDALYERKTLSELNSTPNTWCTQTTGSITTIWAKFGSINPNTELTEINVRECVFFPTITGLKYITVDGFTLKQSANNWCPPGILHKGVIGPRWGLSWIILNCTITDGKCIGVSLGNVPGSSHADISTFGHHIIRNNVIQRNGQCGIFGDFGAAACVIEGNLIEETGYKHEFTGMETGGIKILESVDYSILNNCIRKQGQALANGVMSGGFYGIWVDWSNQGVRISGNVFSVKGDPAIFCEMDHGPQLIDNNIFLDVGGAAFSNYSEGTILVHNLFCTTPQFFSGKDDGRSSPYFVPHTTTSVGSQIWIPSDDQWFNNIFVKKGFSTALTQNPRYKAGYNVYLENAVKCTFDSTGVVSPFACTVTDSANDNEEIISLSMNSSPTDVQCPFITKSLIGNVPLVKQGIENHDGTALSIDKDILGVTRSTVHPVAGPFEDHFTGRKSFTVFRRANPVPIARIAVDKTTGAAPLTVNFSAAGSSAPGGTLQSYSWKFSDGTTATGSTVSHTFLGDSGRLDYLATLLVTASSGKTARTDTTIYIGRTPENPSNTINGLDFKAYTGTWTVLPDFQTLTPTQVGVWPRFSANVVTASNNVGLLITGYIKIAVSGFYHFYTNSDDGSQLLIGNSIVVDNDGVHSASQNRTGAIALNAGMHAISVKYFNGEAVTGGTVKFLTVQWDGPGFVLTSIPDSVLLRNNTVGTINTNQALTKGIGISLLGTTIVASFGQSGTYSIDVVDVMGKVVYKEQYKGPGRLVVPSSTFSAGAYFVKVKANDKTIIKRAIHLSQINR